MAEYKIIPNLQNCTITEPVADFSGSNHYLDPQHTTITLQANDGYTFEEDGSLTYIKNGMYQMGIITIPATHTNTTTVSLPSGIIWYLQHTFNLTMNAVARKPTPKKYVLRPHLTNATIVSPPEQSDDLGYPVYYIDQQHSTFTLKADSGFTFTKDGTLRYNIDDLSTDILKVPASNTDTLTYTVTLPEGVKWENQDIFDLSIDATQTPTYELTATLENAKIIDPKPTTDSHGRTHYYINQKNPTFTIQANDGYKFNNDGSLTYVKDDLADEGTIPVKATHTDTVTFTIPSSINWKYQDYFDLTMGADKTTIVKGTGGFTNIYKADYASLLKISHDVTIRMNGNQTLLYDYSQYIDNLIILPFNVPSGQTAPVVAGDMTLTTNLPTVDNTYLTIDLGTITVPEQYKNAYDYYQVKTRLLLPYTDLIELDPIHVINKTVSIKYIVDVVNGDTTINLYNGDDIFFSQQVNLASEIPFMAETNTTQYVVINKLKTMFRNDIHQAYIIIEQPTPILNSDYYPTNEKGMLKDYTGSVKASLLFNISINENELNALQNLLKTGVNIK